MTNTADPSKHRLLLVAIGKRLRHVYDSAVGEELTIGIERAFEHLRDLTPNQPLR